MEDSWLQTRDDGTIVGRLVRPVDSCGLYVPGGRSGSTPLVSSVLLNGLPTAIAVIERRGMVTSPGVAGEGQGGETEHGAVGEVELDHPIDVEAGLLPENLGVEPSAAILIGDEQNVVCCFHW